MDKFDNYIHLSEKRSSALTIFLVFFLSLFSFYAIGPFLGLILSLPFYDGSLVEFQAAMVKPFENPELKTPLMITQGIATLVGTVITPLAYLYIVEKKTFFEFFKNTIPILPIILSVVIVICFMGVNALFIDWNANIQFPEFMSHFEKWANKSESLAAEMTDYLTNFSGFDEFLLAFLVIAIIPAIGEELLFRGFLQNLFHENTQNIHLAIWISAILFSTIHMQFYGFVPRMLLGALFGYLYYWSGNLTIPIVAHLTNNGFTLIMFYLHDIEIIDTDISNTESSPLYTVLIFSIITAILLFYFRKYFLRASSDK